MPRNVGGSKRTQLGNLEGDADERNGRLGGSAAGLAPYGHLCWAYEDRWSSVRVRWSTSRTGSRTASGSSTSAAAALRRSATSWLGSTASGRPWTAVVSGPRRPAIYGSDEEFIDAVVPFPRDGAAAGEPTLVGIDPRQEQLVRDAMDDTSGITFRRRAVRSPTGHAAVQPGAVRSPTSRALALASPLPVGTTASTDSWWTPRRF